MKPVENEKYCGLDVSELYFQMGECKRGRNKATENLGLSCLLISVPVFKLTHRTYVNLLN